jgi:hypothetical protein
MKKDQKWISNDYVEVLQQLLNIATPSKQFNGHAPCPWLAIGLSTGKVSIERGTGEPIEDVKKIIEQTNYKLWATCYWYQPDMTAKELDLTCKIMSNNNITCLYMHLDDAKDTMGQKLCGKYPMLIVQSKSILDSARNNLPPDYPYKFD